jgi:signal transduction histidine kinase
MTVMLNRKIILALCLIVVIPLLAFLYLSLAPSGVPSSGTLIAGLGGLICILGILTMLGVLRALRRIYQSISGMAHGDAVRQLPVDGSSGISDLAVSINQLSQKLRDTMDELEKRAILIERSNQELKKASQERLDFVAHLVHELRSPLIGIEKSSQLIIDGGATMDAVERTKFLDIINTSARRLYRLTNDLLDLSKIESGNLHLDPQRADIQSLITEAVNTLASWSRSRNIAVRAEYASGLPSVRVDRDRIVQVLVNLLSNAIKFTPHNGRIHIRAALDNTQAAHPCVRVSVEDSGPGIPEEERARIFERYVSSAQQADSVPNTGLGLSIAKHIIDLHNGRIGVESAPHSGSVFFFTVPLDAVAGDARERGPGARKHVLVVDDEEDVRDLLCRELKRRGYETTVASDGLEAVKTALDIPYDLVITDVRMPNIDGIRCYELIRAVMPQTQFIFMTGFAVNPSLEEIRRQGSPCVHKPFDLPSLIAAVDDTLGR